MKKNISVLRGLVITSLAASPAFVLAAVPASSAYNTDTTNSYVQDQTSQAMTQLNGILCYMGAMDPAEMVNLSTNSGNYIALVDDSVCSPNSGGGKGGSTNSGASYQPVIVNSSRASSTSPMIVKVWIDQPQQSSNIKVYASATQAPAAGDPYGRFRMDYAESGTSRTGKGFISSTATGLDFYQDGSGSGGGGGTFAETLQLKLNASTATTGSGSLRKASTFNGTAQPTTAFDFAYNANNFLRTDGSTPQCFSRDPLQAAESVWSYGLYDSTTGARITRNSGFPIEYTDAGGATQNGYVGYYGLWTPTAVPAGATVKQVSYSGGTATKTPYTLLQTGGKLTKFTKVNTTLDGLDKVKFQFWPQTSLTGVVMPAGTTPASLTSGTTYEVYWSKSAVSFVISGQQDSTTFNMVPFATPVVLSIANMKLAAPWGLYGWSQMLGGDFAIDSTTMTSLSATSVVVTHAQNVVYPADFAALTGLMCIDQCPTLVDINLSNAVGAASNISPFGATNRWTGNVASAVGLYNYTLNAAGNLVDAASGIVISTATQATATSTPATTSSNNTWGVRSGRLVAGADKALLDAAVNLRGVTGTAGPYIESDIDALTTYYQWTTSGNNWDKLAILNDVSNMPVRFDPPLNVSFTVPATGAQYGTFVGANVVLQYSGFGDLWGIPSTCIDIASNSPCTFGTGGTTNNNQRWTPQFSIPAGASVTVATTQGAVTAGTSYLVKALDKEVRLANVNISNCSTLTVATSAGLPVAGDCQNPTSLVGTAPTFTTVPAPQVIQGVKMY